MDKDSAAVMTITADVHVATKDPPIYGATKIALHYASKVLRRELGERNTPSRGIPRLNKGKVL
jgi:short-subunit dehydrogenase involved in D-alanine esterification of teichoic acids